MKLKQTSAVEKLNTCYIIEIIDITIEQLHLSPFIISIDNDIKGEQLSLISKGDRSMHLFQLENKCE